MDNVNRHFPPEANAINTASKGCDRQSFTSSYRTAAPTVDIEYMFRRESPMEEATGPLVGEKRTFSNSEISNI